MFLLSFLLSFAYTSNLLYTVSLTNRASVVKINIEFNAGENDTISFDIKNKRIRQISSFYTKDKKKYRIRYSKKGQSVILKKTKNKNIQFNYSVILKQFRYKDKEKSFHIDNLLVLFSKDIFLVPDLVFNSTEQLKISVKYAFPSMWNYASSWKSRSGISEVYSLKDLYAGLIVIGEIKNKYIKLKDKLYLFSFYGLSKTEQKDVIEKYKKIVEKQVALWGYLPNEKLFLTFFKSKKNKKVSEGLQFNNVIFYYLNESVNLNSINLLRLLAHEHFHVWNGSHIKAKKNVQRISWFTEGFTDYYALLTLFQAKLITEKELLNEFSKRAIAYDKREENGELLLSLALDINIVVASKEMNTTDDFIKVIESKPNFWKTGYDNYSLKLALVSLANWDLNDFFDKYILNDNLIEVSDLIAKLGLSIDVKKTCKVQKAYELKKYKKYKKVQKIDKKSNAYLAGLRKRDLITEETVGDNGNLVLKILRRKRKKEISFDPNVCEKNIVWVKTKNNLFDTWLSNREWR